MTRNPAAGVEKPGPRRRENPMTEEHYKKIVAGSRDQQWRDVVVFSWETGARPQETVAIEARHLDCDNERIVFPEEESKGKRFSRVIYLTPTALAIVKRLTKLHAKGVIFRNTDGIAWNGYSTNCRFKRWEKRIGVKYCLYDIRHAWQNRLLKSGVDPMTLAVLAGHVDPSTFARWYQHLSRDSEYLRRALKRSVNASDGIPKAEMLS